MEKTAESSTASRHLLTQTPASLCTACVINVPMDRQAWIEDCDCLVSDGDSAGELRWFCLPNKTDFGGVWR
jgi:hypothetical protein